MSEHGWNDMRQLPHNTTESQLKNFSCEDVLSTDAHQFFTFYVVRSSSQSVQTGTIRDAVKAIGFCGGRPQFSSRVTTDNLKLPEKKNWWSEPHSL